MSQKYPGGVISKTAPTPSGPYADSTAPGVWTLEQQAYWQKLGQWPTAGNVDPSAFIENLFSTYLYTGTSSAQTINNGIDLAGKGGLVWTKDRNLGDNHILIDTVRGVNNAISSNLTNAQFTYSNTVTAFSSTGFTAGTTYNGYNVATWTFREQPKFFDVVTYTGTGAATQTISHNLGSAPGCIIVKATSAVDSWWVYHRASSGTPLQDYLRLNLTNAVGNAGADVWGSTSTTITVDTNLNLTTNGVTYVAYLFAHNAGGFGLTGTDNVISCGSFTADGSGGCSVTLGYEPQWIMYKNTASDGWRMGDVMRGWSQTQWQYLAPNDANVETSLNNNPSYLAPTSTGFNTPTPGLFTAGNTFIYIAIRRGPMAVPTLGTSVFSGISRSGTGATVSVTGAGFPPDAIITKVRNLNGAPAFWDKLRGPNRALTSNTADAEQTTTTEISSFNQDGFSAGTSSTFYTNASGGYTYINWQLKRAPSFFDEVCYTGTGSATTFSHNLQAVPELMICKRRNISASWIVYSAATGNSAILQLEDTGAVQTSVTNWNNTTPTASVFSVGTQGSVNASGGSYVAYLFATCAGVSKVGSYTGTGTLTTVNCGFTGGARFVLIKRTDAVEAWYVWDTIRGMTDGTDPSLRFNNQSSESNANSVYTIATGFQLLASPSADVNTNGGSYIFLAIA
jgi:hypothetical protein